MGFGPQDVGRGYLAVLTIFTILEFFIAVIATHFGCQATRAQAHAVSASHRAPPPAPALQRAPHSYIRELRGVSAGRFSSWVATGARQHQGTCCSLRLDAEPWKAGSGDEGDRCRG